MMKYYKSCSTLLIVPFFRIFETNDFRHLVIGFDEENDTFELTDEQNKELDVIFSNIFYEYSEITDNHKLKATFKKQILIEEWTFIYKVITNCINSYLDYGDENVLFLINKIDNTPYKVDENKPIHKQLIKLTNQMKGLKNKIKIFKLKLAQTQKDDKQETKLDLDRDALMLEKNLELKRAIDPKTTTVSAWVGLIKMNKLKAER